jgi:hypothetical protein
MDPFLENPRRWPDFHHRFITISSDVLLAKLRPKYFVRIEERVYIASDSGADRKKRIPDLQIASNPEWVGEALDFHGDPADVDDPVVATAVLEDEVRESRLEIVDAESQLTVTVIELLSPANKTFAGEGHASFDLKRQEVLHSLSHWVEIDLLRGGVEVETVETLPPHEYLVYVSRTEKRPKGLYWPLRLSRRLPVIPIPLKSEDPDAKLDLQAVLTTVYDRAGYDFSVDYTRDPVPSLEGEWAAWADRLLREKGLRKG